MSGILSVGKIVNLSAGGHVSVIRFLGSGTQGEVYEVDWNDSALALKWYYGPSATAQQRASINDLVRDGPPNSSFLWPINIATSEAIPGFGYVMPLRDRRFVSFTELMSGRIQPSFGAVVNAGIHLTKSFRALHTSGYCYRDIAFGNTFFDPTTGAVAICDNDNVGTNRSSASGVLGTPDFMAPEIVRREADPSIQTDQFSLSVLLFYLLYMNHPLLGRKVLDIRCWDVPARELLFGRNPVFIFDPHDASNAAVDDLELDPLREAGANALRYWTEVYPASLNKLFTEAFTEGLEPAGRVTELQWLNCLCALRDSMFQCQCGATNFYDSSKLGRSGAYQRSCWGCGETLALPFRIKVGSRVVLLHREAELFAHHMGDGRDFDYDTVVARVERHPKDPTVWGLKNMTSNAWSVTTPSGEILSVPPGRRAKLASNVKVAFERVEGEVRY